MEGRHYVGAPHSLSLSPKTSLPAVSEPMPALNFDTAALRPSFPDCCDPKKRLHGPWASCSAGDRCNNSPLTADRDIDDRLHLFVTIFRRPLSFLSTIVYNPCLG